MIRSTLVHAILWSSLVGACMTSADARYIAELDSIVKEHATEHQAAERLKLTFEVHERGTTSWDSLQAFLGREPAGSSAKLRQAVTGLKPFAVGMAGALVVGVVGMTMAIVFGRFNLLCVQ